MVIREKTQKLEWAIFCVLCFGRMGLGAFTFTTYPSQNGNQYTCDGSSAVLIWDYTTDETLKSIDWYKQPGNVLIGNFGLGSFTASAAYTGRVSQYQPGTYKAAIQIANFALSDGGEYSCFVKANTDHSQNGKMFYGDTPVGNVVIDYSDRRNSTCFPPNGTSGVTITWSGSETKTGTDGVYGINTCKGGHVKCSMTGGSASCGNKSYSMEEDIPGFVPSKSSTSDNSSCPFSSTTPTNNGSDSGNKETTIIIVATVVPVGGLMVTVVVGVVIYRKRNKKTNKTLNHDARQQMQQQKQT